MRRAALLVLLLFGCSPATPPAPRAPQTPIEVTARLVEIPPGAIFQRDLYDYATVLKYEVESVQRGTVTNRFLYVGQYNPWKPRATVADGRVPVIGGTLERFVAGQRHRLALEENLDDHYLGGVVNKYFGQPTGPLYWAVWTDPAP